MVSKYELKKIMNILDSDGSDSIEYQEFLRAICDKKLLFREENLRAVFGVIDNNKKGYATPDDIQKFVLGNDKKIRNRSTIKGCSAQIGMKKNSKLTFEQFSEIIHAFKIMMIQVILKLLKKMRMFLKGEIINILLLIILWKK